MVKLTGMCILDAGCGLGDLSSHLNHVGVEFRQYVGVDGLPRMVEKAIARNLPRSEFLAVDFVTDPAVFKMKRPDVVFFSGSLNTLDEENARRIVYDAFDAATSAVVFNFLSDRCSEAMKKTDTGPANRFNTIGWIEQFSRTARTTGNTLTATQMGGDDNIINSIRQDADTGAPGARFGHTASITQNGTDNFIDRVLQTGSGNDATLAIEGDNNGGGALTGLAIVGAENSSAIQQGTSNKLGFAITGGSDNQFGFRQNGTGNEALGLAILGNFNELGVNQSGTTNTVSLATINGNDNVIGFMQNGTSNVASATVAGSGNNNEFGIAQTGTTNDATVNITGSDNGARSTVGLFGVAASVGGTNGLVEQYGMSNIALLNITGDNNAFALAQGSAVADGDNNSITGTVNGNNNAAAVSQSGSNNIAVFAQTGNGNSAGIIQ